MPSKKSLNIDLRRLAKEGGMLSVSLDDAYFKELEQDEIVGGKIEAIIKVRENVEEVFEVSIEIEGDVVVACDRCLEDLVLPVEVEDVIKVYATEDEHLSEESNVRFLEGHGYDYDLSWDVYELVELSLPIQRVHEEGECNPDMLEYLNRVI